MWRHIPDVVWNILLVFVSLPAGLLLGSYRCCFEVLYVRVEGGLMAGSM